MGTEEAEEPLEGPEPLAGPEEPTTPVAEDEEDTVMTEGSGREEEAEEGVSEEGRTRLSCSRRTLRGCCNTEQGTISLYLWIAFSFQ